MQLLKGLAPIWEAWLISSVATGDILARAVARAEALVCR
jgi:hypothetical protein